MKRFVLFFFIPVHLAMAIPPENNIDNTINLLKNYVMMYEEKKSDKNWLLEFSNFLSKKIIFSKDPLKMIDKVCRLRPKYYLECKGPLGFASTIIGTQNNIDYIEKICITTSSQDLCPFYENLLAQDVIQLKYILVM